MRKSFLLICFFISLIGTHSLNAQTWSGVTSNTTQTLWAIDYLNPDYGFVVGWSGTILQSMNNDSNWVSRLTFGNNLYAIEIIDSNNIITGTGNGILSYTTNGGQVWFTRNIGYSGVIYDFYMHDASRIFCAGANGITQGGMIWRGIFPSLWTSIYSDSSGYLRSIDFSDSLNGFAVGEAGKVIRTTDGGNSWVRQTVPTQNYLWNVKALNSNSAIVVGYGGVILKTTNSGMSWNLKESGTTRNLLGLSFFDELKGIAVGDSGTILHTTNGGDSWYPGHSGMLLQLRAVFQPTSTRAVAVGRNGTILITNDNIVVSTKDINDKQPSNFVLSQNYPNPFNPNTTIQFGIPKDSHVEILLYSIHGELIKELLNEEKKGGYHTVNLDLSMYSTGTYFYKIIALPYDGSSGFLQTNKLMLLK